MTVVQQTLTIDEAFDVQPYTQWYALNYYPVQGEYDFNRYLLEVQYYDDGPWEIILLTDPNRHFAVNAKIIYDPRQPKYTEVEVLFLLWAIAPYGLGSDDAPPDDDGTANSGGDNPGNPTGGGTPNSTGDNPGGTGTGSGTGGGTGTGTGGGTTTEPGTPNSTGDTSTSGGGSSDPGTPNSTGDNPPPTGGGVDGTPNSGGDNPNAPAEAMTFSLEGGKDAPDPASNRVNAMQRVTVSAGLSKTDFSPGGGVIGVTPTEFTDTGTHPLSYPADATMIFYWIDWVSDVDYWDAIFASESSSTNTFIFRYDIDLEITFAWDGNRYYLRRFGGAVHNSSAYHALRGSLLAVGTDLRVEVHGAYHVQDARRYSTDHPPPILYVTDYRLSMSVSNAWPSSPVWAIPAIFNDADLAYLNAPSVSNDILRVTQHWSPDVSTGQYYEEITYPGSRTPDQENMPGV